MGEYRQIRRRQDDLRNSLDRVPSPDLFGTPRMRGQVFNAGSMPTTVPGQFAVHPVNVTGAETEGIIPTFTADTSRKAIFTVLGPGVPVVSDILTAAGINGRWVAEKGGTSGGGIVMPPCGCTNIPASLNVSDIAWIHNPGAESYFDATTLTYGARPSDLSYAGTGLPLTAFFSPVLSSNPLPLGDPYRLVLWCFPIGFYAFQAWSTSASSFPSNHWTMTFSAPSGSNTCTPFSLSLNSNSFGEPTNAVLIN